MSASISSGGGRLMTVADASLPGCEGLAVQQATLVLFQDFRLQQAADQDSPVLLRFASDSQASACTYQT